MNPLIFASHNLFLHSIDYYHLQWQRRYENEGIYKSTNVVNLNPNWQSPNLATFVLQDHIPLQRFEALS